MRKEIAMTPSEIIKKYGYTKTHYIVDKNGDAIYGARGDEVAANPDKYDIGGVDYIAAMRLADYSTKEWSLLWDILARLIRKDSEFMNKSDKKSTTDFWNKHHDPLFNWFLEDERTKEEAINMFELAERELVCLSTN